MTSANMTTYTDTLKNMVVVVPGISLWTGQKKLRKEDIKVGDGGALPPKEIASLGHIKSVDPEDLAWSTRAKSRLITRCLSVGTRFLGGYAIPVAKKADLIRNLDEIIAEAKNDKAKFIANYADNVEKHVTARPEWEAVLRRVVTPAHEVASKFHFGYSVIEINPAQDGAGELETEVRSMGQGALDEVATEMRALFENSIDGKERITRKTLWPIERVRNKLDGLSFLDGLFSPLVDALDDLLKSVPDKGPIDALTYQRVVNAVLMLSDPERVRQHGKGLVTIHRMIEGTLIQDVSDLDDEDDVGDPEIEAAESSEDLAEPTHTGDGATENLTAECYADGEGDLGVVGVSGFDNVDPAIVDISPTLDSGAQWATADLI